MVVDVFIAPVGASDGSLVWTGLTPGQGVGYDRIPRGCSEVEFIAKDGTGTLVARSPSPVCRPSVWVIRLPPG